MSVDGSCSRRVPDQALLCWSEAPHSPVREEFVQVLDSYGQDAVIKSTLKVSEQTKVTLIGKDYTGIGIVKSCRGEGTNFIVTISMAHDEAVDASALDRDPGVLSIDSFLTEDEETKILQDLDDWTARWGVFSPTPNLA